MSKQYLLVENRQIVHLGPVFWRPRFIQSVLNDLDTEYTLAPTEPNQYIKISDNIEIFPITSIEQPQYDPAFEQLAGPFWTYGAESVSGTYSVAPRELTAVKNSLKSLAADERYKKEIAGITLTVHSMEINVPTDRETRSNYVQKLIAMTDSVQWKFSEGWVTFSKDEFTAMIQSVDSYVQAQFDWESSIVALIDSATTAEELRAITITPVEEV